MKPLLPLALLLAALPAASALAQAVPNPEPVTVPAPAQPGAVALPDTASLPDREQWFRDSGAHNGLTVRNVTRPSLIPFLPPAGKATGAAMIVAPGGGFLMLAMQNESWSIARWLADHGIAAFVLKYRLLPTPADQRQFATEMAAMVRGGKSSFAPPEDTPTEAYADGLAALRYVRGHAGQYGIDPARVGFMGFSAGGFLTRSLVAQAGPDRPNFAAPIYPNMAAIPVPADAPPLFVAIGGEDFLLTRVKGFPLVEAYQAAHRPVEFHLYAGVPHAFETGIPGTTSEGWLDQLYRWMNAGGWLKRDAKQGEAAVGHPAPDGENRERK